MGGKFGWVVAMVMGTFVAILVVKLVLYPSPTPPSAETAGAEMLALQKPEKPLTLVLPAEPAGGGDAGDDYWRAIQLYDDHAEALKQILKRVGRAGAEGFPLSAEEVGVLEPIARAVAEGAARKKMTYYFRLTPKKIEIPYFAAAAQDFTGLGQVLELLGRHHLSRGREGFAQAEKMFFDLFAMAHHLIQERARLEIVRAGVGLEKVACTGLMELYRRWDKPRRLEQVRRYYRGLRLMSSVYTSLDKRIWDLHGAPDGTRGLHPGDIFNLAANHQDRAVRVEATLALGVVKLTCTRRGDRKMAERLIRRKLESEDPIERAAARSAQALDAAGLKRLARG